MTAASTPVRRASRSSSSAASLAAANPPCAAQLEEAWGATVTEVMGIGDIAASLWGECPEKGGMHFSGRGLVHFELIDPDTGASVPLADGAEGELVYTHLAPGGGAAAPLPEPRPCPALDRALRLRSHRAARPLHRPHRRHAHRPGRQHLPLGAPRDRRRLRARSQRRHLGAPAATWLPPGSAAEGGDRDRRAKRPQAILPNASGIASARCCW